MTDNLTCFSVDLQTDMGCSFLLLQEVFIINIIIIISIMPFFILLDL